MTSAAPLPVSPSITLHSLCSPCLRAGRHTESNCQHMLYAYVVEHREVQAGR
jgi:hypothetical protein